MHNKLIIQDIFNRTSLIVIFIYNLISSLLNILDSEILVKLIEHEKIIYNYKIILSIISCTINVIAFIVFLITSIIR